jgi:hypothetical protein
LIITVPGGVLMMSDADPATDACSAAPATQLAQTATPTTTCFKFTLTPRRDW